MRHSILFMCAILLFPATAAWAQYDYGSLWWDADCSAGGPTAITGQLRIGADFDGRVHSIRVMRQTLSEGACAPSVEVARGPTGALAPGEYELEFTDPESMGGFPFAYRVALYDAAGEDLGVHNYFEMGTLWDIVTCGETAIGHGFLRSPDLSASGDLQRSDPWSPRLVPCAETCWWNLPIANFEDLRVQAYIDSDIPVLLMGDIECVGIIGGCYLVIDGIYEVTCQGGVATHTKSWGSLKARH